MINSATSVNDVTISMQWPAQPDVEGNNFDRDNSFISRWEEGVSNDWQQISSADISDGNDPYIQYATTDFSASSYYFGIGSGGSALPIELISFEAHKENDRTRLSWATSMEKK